MTKQKSDHVTRDLLASPEAIRQARYTEKMKAMGIRQRKFWLTDAEYGVLKQQLDQMRAAHEAAQDGDCGPASA